MDDVIRVIDGKHGDISHDEQIIRQLFCFSEEAGEVMGAFRRMAMGARRSGSEEDFRHEIADVFITLHVLCIRMGYDPEDLMSDKLDIIEARGGR